MSDVLDAQTLIPAARNPVIVIVTPSLAKGVNLKLRWTLDDDAGERKSQFISNGISFFGKKKKRQFEMDWIKIMNGRAHKQPSLALLGLALLGLLQCLQAMIVEPEGQ